MIIGFIVVCGFAQGAPQTVDGCRPYMKLFTSIEFCEEANIEARYLDFGEGTLLAYSDCQDIGEEV